MIVLLCLTPVFKNMPNNAQGAIIIAAVIGLVKYEEWWYLLKVSPTQEPLPSRTALLACAGLGHPASASSALLLHVLQPAR